MCEGDVGWSCWSRAVGTAMRRFCTLKQFYIYCFSYDPLERRNNAYGSFSEYVCIGSTGRVALGFSDGVMMESRPGAPCK